MGAACENRKRLEPAQEAVHKGAKELNRRVPATTVSGAWESVQVKVKVTLEQATKAHRGSRGIALLFL